MTSSYKNLYYLWGLKFVSQIFIGGYYEGKFKFNFKNPLVWIMFMMIYLSFLIGGMFDFIVKPLQELLKLAKECVTVELDKDYDKNN